MTRFAMDGTAAFARDFVTGERRYGTKQDTWTRCGSSRPATSTVMGWPPVAANDRPVGVAAAPRVRDDAHELSKHGQHELHRRDQASVPRGDHLEALAGGEDRARERHQASVVYCPVAPLVHDGEMLDAYLDLGAWDVPVTVLPMPVPGTTGPALAAGEHRPGERGGAVVDRALRAGPTRAGR